MFTIEITNLYPALSISEERINAFFKRVASSYNCNSKGVLSIVFLNKEDHSQLHGQFLNDFRPTDVITFPADPENDLVGEICVSVDQAIEVSDSEKLTLDQELSLYLIHGWLHLVGFDDKNTNDRKIMKREEANALDIIEKDGLWPHFLLASSYAAD